MKVTHALSSSLALSLVSNNVHSFQSNQISTPSRNNQRTKLFASQINSNDDLNIDAIKEAVKDIDVDTIKEAVRTKNVNNDKFSQAIPFLYRPSVLTGELAGDVGFDPLQLSKNREQLYYYREAEIKHARLAMLAAAGWPISELFDAKIANYFGLTPAIDTSTDRVPSLLNGGLENISPKFWGFCLGFCAAIDLYGIQRARYMSDEEETSYVPGDLGFDPLGLYPNDVEEQKNMQLAEIKHGRIAMMACVGYAVQEAILQQGVIDETPQFFFPIF